jgi:predicted RNA-binding protein with PIN domain
MKQFILDGYNIIKSDARGVLAQGTLEEQRERLLALINTAHPAGSVRNTVTVVFDGPYDAPAAPRYRAGGVDVIFSEGKTADEVIEQLVRAAPHPGTIVVVTDDRGLHRMLGGLGAATMSVAEFTRRLFARPASPHDAAGENGAAQDDITREFEKKWIR